MPFSILSQLTAAINRKNNDIELSERERKKTDRLNTTFQALASTGKPLSVATICDAVLLTQATVRNHLKILERQGLVSSSPYRGNSFNPGTFRVTEKGMDAYEEKRYITWNE